MIIHYDLLGGLAAAAAAMVQLVSALLMMSIMAAHVQHLECAGIERLAAYEGHINMQYNALLDRATAAVIGGALAAAMGTASAA